MNNEDIGVLIVDDELAVRESLYNWFRKDGYRCGRAESAVEALRMMNDQTWDIVLLDIKMPGMSGMELQKRIKSIDPNIIVIMITAYASVETAVEALKEGAYDYVTKPVDPDNLSRLVHKAAGQRQLAKENVQLRRKIDQQFETEEFVAQSREMKKILHTVRSVSATDVTVLLRGESGTGKEMVARLIHANSPRKYFPIVPVNCGSLSETLLESELFGHERGSFTGAQYRHKGKLEMAHGGTLFLDEVGSISLKTQVELLRALESKQFHRLGGSQPIAVDFRIICATNQDLEQLVKEGKFREDFYYRINVFEIVIPPLRERVEGIPYLANYFVEKYARQMSKNIRGPAPEAMDLLMSYHWPGNVRELENAIERAMVVGKPPLILPEDLPIRREERPSEPASDSLDDAVRAHIVNVLDKTDWNITRAAKALEIDRVTLYNKIRKYGLSREKR